MADTPLGPSCQAMLAAASPPLATTPVDLPSGSLTDQLAALLNRRNGFYAFESALHVFGSGTSVIGGSIETWNAKDSWKDRYLGLADELYCFAEDIFGVQFAILHDAIVSFDPETAATSPIADSLEGWADAILRDRDVLTGFPIAHTWQLDHGAIEPGRRLVPKIPFVLGGEFQADNVHALDAAEGMHVRADLARQITDLPDGTQVTYRAVD